MRGSEGRREQGRKGGRGGEGLLTSLRHAHKSACQPGWFARAATLVWSVGWGKAHRADRSGPHRHRRKHVELRGQRDGMQVG